MLCFAPALGMEVDEGEPPQSCVSLTSLTEVRDCQSGSGNEAEIQHSNALLHQFIPLGGSHHCSDRRQGPYHVLLASAPLSSLTL